MNCSRTKDLAFAVLVVVAVLLFCAAPRAWADVDAMQLETEPVAIDGVSASAFGTTASCDVAGQDADAAPVLSIARLCPMAVSASCTPSSIEAGISCGMTDMCGIRPCLCGAADDWGGCACNGFETVSPDVSFTSSDDRVVRVAQFAGKTWLVPVGPGTAQVICNASLRYFDSTSATVSVSVGGFTAADAMLVGIVVVAVAAIVLVIVGVRLFLKRRGGSS